LYMFWSRIFEYVHVRIFCVLGRGCHEQMIECEDRVLEVLYAQDGWQWKCVDYLLTMAESFMRHMR
jgi:hypothetical protein